MSITPNQADLDRILDALRLREMGDEDQEEVLNDLSELILETCLARLVEHMDEPTQADFKELMDRNAPEEELEAFVSERVPDADLAVQEAVDELRNDILALTA